MRTYYNWQLYQSSDLKWYIAKVGLWTWAEIGIGILISCLPVSLRFFQHVKVKVYSSFLSRSHSGISGGNGFKLTNSFTRNRMRSTYREPSTQESGISATRMSSGLLESRTILKAEDASLGELGHIAHVWRGMKGSGSHWEAAPAMGWDEFEAGWEETHFTSSTNV